MIAAPDSAHQRYGAFDLTPFRPDLVGVTVVPDGPNRGLAFFADRPPFEGGIGYIWLHPALYGPKPGLNPDYAAWFRDQDGQGSGTCNASDIAWLAAEAERHEGASLSADSHLGVANRLFVSSALHAKFEELYRTSELQLRIEGDRIYNRWRMGTFQPAEDAYDATDRPKIWNALGCTLDLILTDAH